MHVEVGNFSFTVSLVPLSSVLSELNGEAIVDVEEIISLTVISLIKVASQNNWFKKKKKKDFWERQVL